MVRFEIIGRIVSHLMPSDEALEDLLAQLEGDITDETIEVITYGADDTEHLLSSPRNTEDLQQAIKQLNGQYLLMPDTEYAD